MSLYARVSGENLANFVTDTESSLWFRPLRNVATISVRLRFCACSSVRMLRMLNFLISRKFAFLLNCSCRQKHHEESKRGIAFSRKRENGRRLFFERFVFNFFSCSAILLLLRSKSLKRAKSLACSIDNYFYHLWRFKIVSTRFGSCRGKNEWHSSLTPPKHLSSISFTIRSISSLYAPERFSINHAP